jgi:hypothetical protein
MNNTASNILNNLDSDTIATLRESNVGKVLAATIAVLEQTQAETASALAAFDAAEALSKRNKSRATLIAALTPANEAALKRRRDAFNAYYAARQLFIADRHADRIKAAAAVVLFHQNVTTDIGAFVAAAKDALLTNVARTTIEFNAGNGIVGSICVREGKVDDVALFIHAFRGRDEARQWNAVTVRSESYTNGAYLSTIGTTVDARDVRAYAQATIAAADIHAVLQQADREGAADAKDLADALFPIDHIG